MTYRIERTLTRTDAFTLSLAMDTAMKRMVWLKVWTRALGDDERARVHRETRALMRVEHPSVIMLHDHSNADADQPFIAYEPLSGPTLAEKIERDGPLQQDELVSIFTQLASALVTLHDAGLAHRDLASERVRLEPDGRAVITDLASAADTDAGDGTFVSRQTQVTKRSPFLPDEPRTEATDIYSLGAMMLHAWRGEITQPLAKADDSPLGRLITRCTSTKRPSAREVLEALQTLGTKASAESDEQRQIRRLLADGELIRALTIATKARYERFELLGQGGMGRVLRAHDSKLGRAVAVKTMLDSVEEDAAMRFHREARALGRVRHPNVVEVVDYSGRGAPLPFIVLELVEGPTLGAVLDLAKAPETAALCLMKELAAGVAAIHTQGLVHRDLKPENVFLDAAGRAVIGDFGIVRGEQALASKTFVRAQTQAIGSPLFASPEQVYAPDSVTTASDLFSLGSVLFALLTQASPFAAKTPGETVARLHTANAAPLPANVSPFFQRLVPRLLALKPLERPTATELEAEITSELRARSVVDPRREIRKFLGLEDSHTQIFTSATKLVTVQRQKQTGKVKRSFKLAGGWMIGLAAGVLVGVVGLAVRPLLRPAPKPRPVVISAPASAPIGELPQPSSVAVPVVPEEVKILPEKPKPVAPSKPALLRFIIKPWAAVSVDGAPIGTTPVLRTTELSPGRHTLVFTNPTFQRKSLTIDLKAGEQREIRVLLER